MFSIKSLRAKTVLSAFIPTALVLVVAAIIGLYAYEQAAREVIQQRDAELARVSAARLSENLGQYEWILRSVAAQGDVQSMEPARLGPALEDAQNQLYVFDAGVVVYNNAGVALRSQPDAAERQGTTFPVPSDFDKVRTTLRPVFSDVFKDEISGEDVILVAVPTVGKSGEFKGVLSGMFKMKYPLLGPIYAEVLQLRVGHTGYAYLVDGNGRVIYHRDGSQVGRNLAAIEPVMRAIGGEVGSILTEDSTGETIISGFASVPGTGWVLITQERWDAVVGPIRSYSSLLLGVLVGGGLLSCIVMFFSIGRILRPIQDLTQGAQRIAGGDFEYSITAKTGDEIQALARQFNTMASALKESYSDLERRVADRTRELTTLNAIAEVVGRSLNLEEILSDVLNETLAMLAVESGGIFLMEPDGEAMTLRVHRGLSEEFVESVQHVRLGEGVSGQAVAQGKPVALDVQDYPTERLAPFVLKEGIQTLASTPILHKDRTLGVLALSTKRPRAFPSRELELLAAIGYQIGMGVENAWLYTKVQRELTERREAEEALRQARETALEAQRVAEAANQAKSVFLANMSHELRTPLNAILGFSELMTRDPALTSEQQENLEIIGQSGEHLLGLINDVLELSKIEAGRVVLQEEDFDLHRLLDGLEEMLRLRAMDRGLTLLFDRAPDLPQYVRMDQSKLRQVLINLLGNAVKYTKEGGITLRAGSKEVAPITLLRFEVEDTGVGIAPEELDAVFEPFVQTASGRQSRKGTGLGMPISRQFVRMMGGDLTVSSKLGKGTTFKFGVRAELADATDVQTAQPKRRVLGLEPGQPIYRLLVVEDREASRKLLVKLLQPLGFQVREATNGQEALEVWERWDPHLIWMDMRMPVMDGHEATRRIKATPQGQSTIIIALTASAFEEERAVVLAEGCDDFVHKPYREADILDKLTKHLRVRFVYADTGEGAKGEKVVEEVLTPAALVSLSAAWVGDLYQAATQADADLVLDLLDQIREQNVPLANALASLVHEFRFDTLMTLAQQVEGRFEQQGD